MPEMNGCDAIIEIRKIGYHGPIIGVSGNVMDDDKQIFLNSGASAVIEKPVDITKLDAVFSGFVLMCLLDFQFLIFSF